MGREGLMTGRIVAPVIAVDAQGVGWHRSSRCSPTGNPQCVEVALTRRVVRVRDSKSLQAGELRISRSGWSLFVGHLGAAVSRSRPAA
ncbi:DUF397 domain-containing protein [Amycolatopsis sp. NPDC004169]|uniref:DUF397 domain-containing protein n=1 Tax=Amycolatopsis sp. NPDC004169 TaxID=3154453 RepID=UPI0033B348E8